MINPAESSNSASSWSAYLKAVNNWIMGSLNSQNQAKNNQEVEMSLVSTRKPGGLWSTLPNDLLEDISPFLKPMELGRSIVRTCKLWKAAMNTNNRVWSWQTERLGLNFFPQLRALSQGWNHKLPLPLLSRMGRYDSINIPEAKNQFADPKPAIAFGRQDYIDHDVGDPGDVPRLRADIHEILQAPCPFFEGKTVEESHALVFVSPEFTKIVKGRSVVVPGTVIDISALVKNSRKGNGVGIDTIYSSVAKKHGKTRIKKGYWVLMTKDVIPGSRRKIYEEQEAMLKAKGYEVPSFYEATTVVLTEYLRTGKRLFSGEQPFTYIRCKEMIDGYHLNVGAFTPTGMEVVQGNYVGRSHGVAALRKL